MEEVHWYLKTSEQVFKQLESKPDTGRSETEVQNRQNEFGLNRIPEPKGKSLFGIFIGQFLSPLIYVLVAAGVVFFFAG